MQMLYYCLPYAYVKRSVSKLFPTFVPTNTDELTHIVFLNNIF